LVTRSSSAFELLEDSEQHERYHQPHSDFGEPLIVHRGSFIESIGPVPGPSDAPYAHTIAVDVGDFSPHKGVTLR